MKKLLRKFISWVMRDDEDDYAEIRPATRRSRRGNSISVEDNLRSSSMTFNLYAAEGGTVIETTMYSEKNDRNENRLYLIADGEDFTSTLGQIVSMERMKSWH